MGAQMTKELGLYNEEEKVCTPVGPQRYRLLNSDPRSVTVGIARTPIQVECTPTGVKTITNAVECTPTGVKTITNAVECTPTGVKTITNAVECTPTGVKTVSKTKSFSEAASFTEDTENQSYIDNDSGYKEEAKDDESIVMEETKASPVERETRYLETDIDKLDSPATIASATLTPLMKEDKSHFVCDVRSPSFDIARTPVLVECTPELFALHSRIDSLSFCDFDVQMEDPSVIVSEDDQTPQHNESSVNNWLINVDTKPGNETPFNNSFAESPKQVARKQKELNAMKKQLFFTPDVKQIAKPKPRTPLGDLQASQLQDSPLKLVRSKQWRNIAEERQRRGLLDSENTPPNLTLPPLSKVSSAPGKMLERKRSKINWDEENVMLI
ncbi:hypothetical protein J6590_012175 [Homalodisca vitripennis]|nr:hypothetical protein J6590_012175 [Homalodisca vitripennis]